jgi:hypothetical protein
MPRQPFRVAAATGEIALGLPAVVLFAAAIIYLVDDSDVDSNRGMLVGITLLLGGALFFIWLYARARRRLLITLIICSGALFAVSTMIAIVLYRPSRFDSLHGVWGASIAAGLDLLLWLVIAILSVIELRLIRDDDRLTMPGWAYLPSIVAPLALIVALTIMIATMMPRWLLGLNSTTSELSSPQPGHGSELSGGSRWTHELVGEQAVATSYGIAVPVEADGSHSAGVIMIDAGTGKQLWRYQLHGAADAPTLEVTDNGRGIVVELDESGDRIPDRTYVLDSETGKVSGVWPNSGAVVGTDPPVLFDHVANTANSVIAISTAGDTLWTYHPDLCADPRSVSSTPQVMVVRARRCGADHGQLDIIGFDARTGDKLWTRPAEAGSGESQPDESLARPAFRLELVDADVGDGHGDPALIRRDLADGSIDWKSAAGSECNRNELVGGGRTAFLATCRDTAAHEPNEIAGFSMDTGKQTLRHKINGRLTAMAGVDDRTVLALVERDKVCRLERIGSRTTTLLSLPTELTDDHRSIAYCSDAQLLTVGRNRVLQIRVRDTTGSLEGRYRFIGLR